VSRVRESIEIDAPVESVFAFFDDLSNAAVLVPALEEVTKVELVECGGHRVEYTIRTESGDVTEASSEHLEYEPPHRTVSRGLQSGIATTSTREFEPILGGTRLTTTIEWDVPVRYVGRLVTAPLRGPLRRSLRETLHAAKDSIESRPDP
jgi:carbon monoxide dehydrogenase subunit G